MNPFVLAAIAAAVLLAALGIAVVLASGTLTRRDYGVPRDVMSRDTTEVPPGQDPFITRQQEGEHK